MQTNTKDNGWLQGQSNLTNIVDQNLTIWALNITSTQNNRINYGINTCSKNEMRLSTEIAKAMHRTACRNQPTWQTFPPVSLPACIVCVCVFVYTSAQKKITTMSSAFTQTQHFTKQAYRTYRLHSSDCCWGRFLEAGFLQHAYALPIETNTNPTLTFLSTALHDSAFHFTDWPRDGSTSPRFVYAVIVLLTVTGAAQAQR